MKYKTINKSLIKTIIKLCSAFFIVAIFFSCNLSFAMSENYYCPKEIKKVVNDTEGVKDCSVIIIGDKIIAAILPETIFTKSQRDEMINKIAKDLKNYKKTAKIAVTFDLDVFLKMKKIETQIIEGAAITDLSLNLIDIVNTLEKRGQLKEVG